MVDGRIKGDNELVANLEKIEKGTKLAIAKALQLSAVLVEGVAKRIVPVDTGSLRGSITSASDEERAIVGTNVEYGPFVELGTSRMRAQPYLRPALTRSRSKIIQIFKRLVDKNIRAVIKK